MLILTRKLGESILIGTNIQVKILNINGKQVRLGIEAPKNYAVHRQEVYQKIQEENINAALNTSKVENFDKIWLKKEE